MRKTFGRELVKAVGKGSRPRDAEPAAFLVPWRILSVRPAAAFR
ncbi:hypothetical protein B4135_3880 [Caldibacillus debilis]|uniref:Uncharacterized protein n=1 Tax=Caldibacillus debilis TaxID=301148 RepID=A0A150LAD0_9BACI|nr:hypothetical protein B4135_3880 [Caldibacillus debilis]